MKMKAHISTVAVLLVLGLSCVIADATVQKKTGQTIYVPVYSHIYSGNRERAFNLAVTLSIRNTDSKNAITLAVVDYYDSHGVMVRHYLGENLTVGPMASIRYVVKESDTTGGSGANFIVVWSSKTAVSPPVLESVMIGTQSQQGLSFTSRGVVISEESH